MIETTAPSAFVSVPAEFQNPAFLKFEILANGIRLTPDAYERIFGTSSSVRLKRPIRTRSGSSGGLDIQLKGDIFVNAPIVEGDGVVPSVALDWVDEGFVVVGHGLPPEKATVLPEPDFYSKQTSIDKIPMQRIAQMCSPDRLCYGMTGPKCTFWNADDRCRFCSIGFNASSDEPYKKDDHLYEVLGQALSEKHWPAQHIMIGGGTPSGPDMGAILAAHLCAGIKSRFDTSVYVMIAAPLQDKYINLLYDSGVDELAINLEFWSDDAWEQYIPGKNRHIGKSRYLKALEHAASLFGPVRTRSILMAGLEREDETLTAVETLARMGVMPILSPFRPLEGTPLAKTGGFSTGRYISLYEESRQRCHIHGLSLGPTCVCCQNNTLTLPFDPLINRTAESQRR